MPTNALIGRLAALAGLAAAAVVLVLLLLGGGGSYTVKARFIDAGGLVRGSLVEVAGGKVGVVGDIRLTDDSQAEIELKLDDDGYIPLHLGTRATIRALGQAGIANRVVALAPGPASAAKIPDGGVLEADRTRPIVDLDVLLDSFDEPARRQIKGILRNAAKVTDGAAADQANRTLHYLNPALSQAHALSVELVRDPIADERLLVTGAATAHALASRSDDLEQLIPNTAATLGAIADQSEAYEDALGRAPDVLRRTSVTLRRTRAALKVIRPALREARPAAAPLADVLREFGPTARAALPVLVDLRSLVPAVRRTARGLPPLARAAVPALVSTSSSLRRLSPIFAGLRPYAPDLVYGLTATNKTSGTYDANGKLLRMALNVPGSTGVLAPLLGLNLGHVRSSRTGLTARCPGGAAESAPDGSNPWIPSGSLCDSEHDHR